MSKIESIKTSGGKKTGKKKPKFKDHGRNVKGIDPNDPVITGVGDLSSVGSVKTSRLFNQAFIKFLGKSDNRVSTEYPVLKEVETSGCYWSLGYPRSRRPRQPQDGDVMFMGRLVDDAGKDDIIIFGRAIAMKHVDERDVASTEEIAASRDNWRGIWDKYIRVHDAELVAGTLNNGVRLSKLMDKLGGKLFSPDSKKFNKRRRKYKSQALIYASG